MDPHKLVIELNDELYKKHGDSLDKTYTYESTGLTEAILFEGMCLWHCQDDLVEEEDGLPGFGHIKGRLRYLLNYAL